MHGLLDVQPLHHHLQQVLPELAVPVMDASAPVQAVTWF
jgi:hypothetical protein